MIYSMDFLSNGFCDKSRNCNVEAYAFIMSQSMKRNESKAHLYGICTH